MSFLSNPFKAHKSAFNFGRPGNFGGSPGGLAGYFGRMGQPNPLQAPLSGQPQMGGPAQMGWRVGPWQQMGTGGNLPAQAGGMFPHQANPRGESMGRPGAFQQRYFLK